MKIKRLGFWIVFGAIVSVCFFFFFGDQNIFDILHTHGLLKERAAELESVRHTLDSLKAEKKQLENDTSYLEKIARERLGMARKNEKVYKFVEEKK